MYRASDASLGREVAIKVLPTLFTRDPDRLARFEREARLLASLNHPNIETIHGVEHHGDIRALVLEVVEGETLAQRLRTAASGTRAGLPIVDALTRGMDNARTTGSSVDRDVQDDAASDERFDLREVLGRLPRIEGTVAQFADNGYRQKVFADA
ncbi:MAG TPA: protein kinase [Vicinamibacterales bacterium]|nr:protein kinase [Vicinamibacterales bacterium]